MTMLYMILTDSNNGCEIKKLNKQQNVCNFIVTYTFSESTKLYGNILLFFKINEEKMEMIKNKRTLTNLESIVLDSLTSIFKTKSEFITDKKNISKIIKIKNTPFTSRISCRNDGIINLITNSELPKSVHKEMLKEILTNEGIEFNEENFNVCSSTIDKDNLKSQVDKRKHNIKRKYCNTNKPVVDYISDTSLDDNSSDDYISDEQKNIRKKIKCK